MMHDYDSWALLYVEAGRAGLQEEGGVGWAQVGILPRSSPIQQYLSLL